MLGYPHYPGIRQRGSGFQEGTRVRTHIRTRLYPADLSARVSEPVPITTHLVVNSIRLVHLIHGITQRIIALIISDIFNNSDALHSSLLSPTYLSYCR